MSTYDEGWMAFYQGVSPYDNPYSPENFYDDFEMESELPEFLADIEDKLIDDLGDLTDEGELTIDTICSNLTKFVQEKLNDIILNQLSFFSSRYDDWIKGHKAATELEGRYTIRKINKISQGVDCD